MSTSISTDPSPAEPVQANQLANRLVGSNYQNFRDGSDPEAREYNARNGGLGSFANSPSNRFQYNAELTDRLDRRLVSYKSDFEKSEGIFAFKGVDNNSQYEAHKYHQLLREYAPVQDTREREVWRHVLMNTLSITSLEWSRFRIGRANPDKVRLEKELQANPHFADVIIETKRNQKDNPTVRLNASLVAPTVKDVLKGGYVEMRDLHGNVPVDREFIRLTQSLVGHPVHGRSHERGGDRQHSRFLQDLERFQGQANLLRDRFGGERLECNVFTALDNKMLASLLSCDKNICIGSFNPWEQIKNGTFAEQANCFQKQSVIEIGTKGEKAAQFHKTISKMVDFLQIPYVPENPNVVTKHTFEFLKQHNLIHRDANIVDSAELTRGLRNVEFRAILNLVSGANTLREGSEGFEVEVFQRAIAAAAKNMGAAYTPENSQAITAHTLDFLKEKNFLPGDATVIDVTAVVDVLNAGVAGLEASQIRPGASRSARTPPPLPQAAAASSEAPDAAAGGVATTPDMKNNPAQEPTVLDAKPVVSTNDPVRSFTPIGSGSSIVSTAGHLLGTTVVSGELPEQSTAPSSDVITANAAHYAVLGLDVGAHEDDIKSAYDRLSKQYRTEREAAASEEERREVNKKMRILRDAYQSLTFIDVK